MSVFVTAGTFKGLPAVHVGNKNISLRVLTGGGHIACVEAPGVHFNPLWEPHWATTTPALRKLVGTSSKFSQAPADRLESELLSCICGHNLCCDVFGAHSAGEVKSGASFHGEAAMCTWEVIDVVRTFLTLLDDRTVVNLNSQVQQHFTWHTNTSFPASMYVFCVFPMTTSIVEMCEWALGRFLP